MGVGFERLGERRRDWLKRRETVHDDGHDHVHDSDPEPKKVQPMGPKVLSGGPARNGAILLLEELARDRLTATDLREARCPRPSMQTRRARDA
jgi:hypothetical protein